MFDHKGVVSTEVKGNLEEATDHAIQSDAEDVLEYVHGDTKEFQVIVATRKEGEACKISITFLCFQFLCEPRSVFDVKKRLVDLGYVVISAEVQYIPHTRVPLNDGELENLQKLCDKLADMEEIVKMYDNVE